MFTLLVTTAILITPWVHSSCYATAILITPCVHSSCYDCNFNNTMGSLFLLRDCNFNNTMGSLFLLHNCNFNNTMGSLLMSLMQITYHNRCLLHIQNKSDYYKYSFFPIKIPQWNDLLLQLQRQIPWISSTPSKEKKIK